MQVDRPRQDLDRSGARLRERRPGPTSPRSPAAPTGEHVYVSWNGPQGGDLYVGMSHDFGRTWTQHEAVELQALLLRVRRATCCPTAPSSSPRAASTTTGPARTRRAAWSGTTPCISRDRGPTWKQRRGRHGRRSASPAWPTGCGARLLHRARRAWSQRPDRTSRVRLRGRDGRPAGRSGSYVRTSTNDGPHVERVESRCRVTGENATGPAARLRRPRRRARSGTCRRRTAATPTRGTCGTGSSARRRHDVERRRSSSATPPAGAAVRERRTGSDEIYGDYGEIAVTNDGQDDRGLGRGLQLHRPRRHLVQRPTAAAARRLPAGTTRMP